MTSSIRPHRRMKEGAAVAGGILFSVGMGLLYQKFIGLQIGTGVFTYSLSFTIPVVLCAAGTYLAAALLIRRILLQRVSVLQEPDELPAFKEDDYISDDFSDEPYIPSEEENPPDLVSGAVGQRAEKIASALAAQRGAAIDTAMQEQTVSEEENNIWDTFYNRPASSEEDIIENFYADVPEELPEGYVLPEQNLEEEEQESLLEEEVEICTRSLLWDFMPIVCILLLFSGILWIFTSCWTKAGEDGLLAARMGGMRQYSWDQVASYEVKAAFSSGEMKLCFRMKDGRQVKISPGAFAQTGLFADQYENLYQYWLHVDNILEERGIEKTVAQREYLADTYISKEDGSWQYVRQIIEYEEELPELS